MKKNTLLFALLCSTLILAAQDVDKKYMAGAIPEVDGKVVLNRSIKISTDVSNERLFELVEAWAQEAYDNPEVNTRKMPLVKKDDSYLVCQGEDVLVFRSGFLNQDQAKMRYQLIIRTQVGEVTLEFKYIKYLYQNVKDILLAEQMITNKYAMHKKGEKLNRYYDKFRTFTIDHVDAIRDDLYAHLGKIPLQEAKKEKEKKPSILSVVDQTKTPTAAISSANQTATTQLPAPVATRALAHDASANISGYKQLTADKLSGSMLVMLKSENALITTSNATARILLGAIGNKQEKDVYVSLASTEVKAGETYTISFYTDIHSDALNQINSDKAQGLTPMNTPSGAKTYSEAWLIIECKKWASDNLSTDTTMAVGEIVNIWSR